MNTLNTQYDIIIAGAGPVGLFLACELALAKCTVLILEQAQQADTPLKHLPFGLRGLNAPTIEALDRRGLLDQLETARRLTHPFGHVASAQAGHFAGIPFMRDDIDTARWPQRLPDARPASLLSEMAETEAVLTRRALALGVEIRRGMALSGATQDDAGVTVHACGASFRALWLVGCDGARSAVRKAGGFVFDGTEPEFTGYTLKADVTDGGRLKPGRNITPHGMYFQSQPGVFAIQDFDGGAFHASGQAVTPAHAQQLLRRIAGVDVRIDALHIAATWTDRARQATSYRNGRMLLAGDAAHMHSPLGGQGLNLGIGDAMNLGWKLAATVRGHAPDGLLDTYHAERHPVGARVLDWSRAQVALMRPDPGSNALHAVFRDLMRTSDVATYVAGRVWGIAPADTDTLKGHSVPDFQFEDGTRLAAMMHDGAPLLLDFDGVAALRAWAGENGVQYVGGAVRERLGASALLVRPDGVVAWQAGGEEDGGDLRQAAARWFSGVRRAS